MRVNVLVIEPDTNAPKPRGMGWLALVKGCGLEKAADVVVDSLQRYWNEELRWERVIYTPIYTDAHRSSIGCGGFHYAEYSAPTEVGFVLVEQIGWYSISEKELQRRYKTDNIHRLINHAIMEAHTELTKINFWLGGDVYQYRLYELEENELRLKLVKNCGGFYDAPQLARQLKGTLAVYVSETVFLSAIVLVEVAGDVLEIEYKRDTCSDETALLETVLENIINRYA